MARVSSLMDVTLPSRLGEKPSLLEARAMKAQLLIELGAQRVAADAITQAIPGSTGPRMNSVRSCP